ncbi:hypothetical protein CL633_01315 [bacterium]|nr:hypothetical protein [bacterium]|tara:strand:+ start:7425 stop:8120 length:696 start_codon:yes stop_codon:yes gene_type:complete
MTEDYKKYTKQAQLGNKGEAFFESLISDYCLAHRIAGSKDLGIDFICEWVYGDHPTGILFGVQVKTLTAKAEKIGIETRLNGLDKFKIKNSNLIIKDKTLNYWKGLGMPIYLFAILPRANQFDCYYKRFTPVLTLNENQKKLVFYKVNRNNKFFAFKNFQKKTQGFVRDLYIDYMRWNYYKGSLAYLNPRTIGLNQYPDQESAVFEDLFNNYKEKICTTYQKLEKYLRLKV